MTGGNSGDVAPGTVAAMVRVTRALLAVSVRSVAATGDVVTLPQLRVLTLVARPGTTTVGAVATELGVHPSNATRVVGRLARAGLLARGPDPADRRHVVLELTDQGRRLVADVDDHRRAEVAALLARVPPELLDGVGPVLDAVADAAGEQG